MKTIVIDPVTRISGLLKIEVDIEKNKVINARTSGGQFRGFEKMFQGRPPLDIIWLSSRLCGICSTHHTLAATLALENALNIKPDYNGVVARDIANGFEFLQNHLRQIYLFALPDYIEPPNINPIYNSQNKIKYRVSKKVTDNYKENYIKAMECSRLAHRAIALLAGKAPHNHGIFVGGINTTIDLNIIEEIRFIIKKITTFIEESMVSDIFNVAHYYKEYYKVGRGYGNLMDFGLYCNYEDNIRYSCEAILIDNKKESINFDEIREDIRYSWLSSEKDEIIPGISNPPSIDYKKEGAYSWVSAPRYKGNAVEGGPIARMILSGNYNNQVSAMDRIVTRVLEAKKICGSIQGLIKILEIKNAFQKEWDIPNKASGLGTTAAARGCLAHWVKIEDGLIKNYTVIPPSTWNLSPTDSKGIKGPVEKALIGTEIEDVKNPIEVSRIVRSFDPCLNCAAHITSDKYSPIVVNIL